MDAVPFLPPFPNTPQGHVLIIPAPIPDTVGSFMPAPLVASLLCTKALHHEYQHCTQNLHISTGVGEEAKIQNKEIRILQFFHETIETFP